MGRTAAVHRHPLDNYTYVVIPRAFPQCGEPTLWGDTRRAREELIPDLRFPTLESGLETLQDLLE